MISQMHSALCSFESKTIGVMSITRVDRTYGPAAQMI